MCFQEILILVNYLLFLRLKSIDSQRFSYSASYMDVLDILFLSGRDGVLIVLISSKSSEKRLDSFKKTCFYSLTIIIMQCVRLISRKELLKHVVFYRKSSRFAPKKIAARWQRFIRDFKAQVKSTTKTELCFTLWRMMQTSNAECQSTFSLTHFPIREICYVLRAYCNLVISCYIYISLIC